MTRFIQQQKIREMVKQSTKRIPETPCPNCENKVVNTRNIRKKRK